MIRWTVRNLCISDWWIFKGNINHSSGIILGFIIFYFADLLITCEFVMVCHLLAHLSLFVTVLATVEDIELTTFSGLVFTKTSRSCNIAQSSWRFYKYQTKGRKLKDEWMSVEWVLVESFESSPINYEWYSWRMTCWSS